MFQLKLPVEISTIIEISDPVYTFCEVMDSIDLEKNKGEMPMTPKQKVLSIRLAELIIKNHTFAKSIGLEVKNKFEKKSKEEN